MNAEEHRIRYCTARAVSRRAAADSAHWTKDVRATLLIVSDG